jgi:hypothetical protein
MIQKKKTLETLSIYTKLVQLFNLNGIKSFKQVITSEKIGKNYQSLDCNCNSIGGNYGYYWWVGTLILYKDTCSISIVSDRPCFDGNVGNL